MNIDNRFARILGKKRSGECGEPMAASHPLYYVRRLATGEAVTQTGETIIPPGKSKKDRLGFIDWTRGMATLVMLQGHVWESFTDKSLRDSGVYVLSQFPGGVAPAVFLFLAGVTLAFLIDGREKRGASPRERFLAALRRAGFLAGLAILFRFQMWLFYYPYGAWDGLLRVDILNCMGAACLMLAPLAGLRRMWRVRGALLIGIIIAFGAPFLSDWKAVAPESLLRSYLAPDYNGFALFPWGAYVAFGMACGTAFRLIPENGREQVMQWIGWGGFILAILCQYISNLPYAIYPRSEFWLDSPCLTLIKCGLILVVLAFAYFWNEWMPRLREEAGSSLRFSVPRQLGTTSLLIYWVHVEIVYGRWFEGYKQNMSLEATLVAAIAVIAVMIAISYGKTALVTSEWWTNAKRRIPLLS